MTLGDLLLRIVVWAVLYLLLVCWLTFVEVAVMTWWEWKLRRGEIPWITSSERDER